MMKYFFNLLLALLLTSTVLFAENLTIPPYDNRLDKYPNTTEWYNHADIDSASAFNIGLLYDTKINDNKLAEIWYKKALFLDPNNIDALINLGVLCDDTKRYDDAIRWYKQAYSRTNNKDAANNLGLIYDHKKKYKLANLWYIKAIKKESLEAIKNLGRLYHYKLNDDVKAAEYFIALIDNKYPKDKVLTYLKNNWKLSDKTIKKGYEAQLKSKIIPEKLKYKGGI
ncbi:tetratricopeptide repeat protein [Sulfurimonas sp. HSL3-2]|uniref:tetratricopeptide repeat protein n=1 Tax=Hydrocurvibacter mobilis TaxID=3131936 RepID=UPI0031F76FE2